jgi:hypothetical protein
MEQDVLLKLNIPNFAFALTLFKGIFTKVLQVCFQVFNIVLSMRNQNRKKTVSTRLQRDPISIVLFPSPTDGLMFRSISGDSELENGMSYTTVEEQ